MSDYIYSMIKCTALIKCPECGKEISSFSKVCIHCGFPIENAVVKESNCPFDFLKSIDRRLYQRYLTVETNINSKSNSFYDSLMDLIESSLNYILKEQNFITKINERTVVAIMRNDDVRCFFLYKLNYNPEIYNDIINICIEINSHKHNKEIKFSKDSAIYKLKKVYEFLIIYFCKYKDIKCEDFNEEFYENINSNDDNLNSSSSKNKYLIKNFENGNITLQYENYKLTIKNKVLIQYDGDAKIVDLSDIEVCEIGPSAFENNLYLSKVILPDTVIKIGEDSFANCSNLFNVEFSSILKEISRYAFHNCSSLKEIKLNPDLETIRDYAFKNCENIHSITFNKNISSIGNEMRPKS